MSRGCRCVPYALAWGHSIVVAGNDGAVVFYNETGEVERRFDSTVPSERANLEVSATPEAKTRGEFTVACFNPTGDTVVLGNWNSFYSYTYNQRQDSWEEIGPKHIQNLYAITSLAWKHDGGRLAVGSLFGSLDLYDACVRRYQFKNKFEFTYSSLSQVIVKQLETGRRIVLKSVYGCEVTKINIYQDRYVVANTRDSSSTTETLLLGDLATYKLSEISWENGGNEKFVFDNPACCIVYHAGELTLVEYGCNEACGTVRTDYISGHLLSVRMNEPQPTRADDDFANSKKMAYLLDAQTINIKDLVTGSSSTVSQNSKIDWLELNGRANLLLFRDKRRQLHLYDVRTQARTTLLTYCTYVQWVPHSDVVVAQNRGSLCVWYNIHTPDQVTVHQIKGRVVDIERANGRTEVIVDELLSTASYLLDEALIEFGSAIDDHAYDRAADILEILERSPEAEGMWKKLEEIAFSGNNLLVAHRCAAALGNVGRARYLHRLIKLVRKNAMGLDYFLVRSRHALLQKDGRAAENILLLQGNVTEAIRMHHQLHNLDRAVAIAKERKHPDAMKMQLDHFQYLLDSNQVSKAAYLKEAGGEFLPAIELYLQGGMPSHAVRLIKHNNVDNSPSIVEQVAASFTSGGLYEQAGEFYQFADQLQRAMDAFLKGSSFRKAVELARKHFPGRVVELHERWGDYLIENNQVDMAINHYIEASLSSKAIEAALTCRQWTRAIQLLESVECSMAQPYLCRLAHHYEDIDDTREAERFYVAAGAPEKAVEMYTRVNLWDCAHKVASSYMEPREVSLLYISQAQHLEAEGNLKDAEKLYLTIDEPDLAINMYKKQRKYDAMVQLVEKHRQELLKETHQYLAQHLESEGNLRDAEHHYCEANEWLSAVNMYRTNDIWEEAMRVATMHGGPNASKRVAYAWALSLGGDAGAKLLTKQGLIEPAIDYAVESGAFDHAFELARSACPEKLSDVHLKHALYLEDEERYKEAELEFIQARKPREAVDMYIHQQAWSDALAVANTYDPTAASDIYISQARVKVDAGKYQHAEELFLLAAKPELALSMYKDAGMWVEALALAERHLPHMLSNVSLAYSQAEARRGTGGSKINFISTGQQLEQKGQWDSAVDAYLNARQELIKDPGDLEEIWYCAVAVARQHMPTNRCHDIVADVSRRLREIGRHETAAELLRESNDLRGAIECAIEGRCWAKARELAIGSSEFEAEVDLAYQAALRSAEDTDGLFELGHRAAAMDILVERREWDKLWQKIDYEGFNFSVRAKYAGLQAAQITSDGTNLIMAVRTLNQHGAPPPGSNMKMYRALVVAVLGQDHSQVHLDQKHHKTLVSELRNVLFDLGRSNKETQHDALGVHTSDGFEQLLMATHYYNLYLTCMQHGLKGIALKISVTLIRYAGIIPIDKVFYLAGTIARDQGHDNLAFLLLNRYIDLTEAIDEESIDNIDNADFADATNIPFPFDLPSKQYLVEEEDREEIRDWVLSTCMDKSIDQQLPGSKLSLGTVYAGLYASDLPTCIVTGSPVQKWELLQVNNSIANKVDWNQFVRKVKLCPWTQVEQNPIY